MDINKKSVAVMIDELITTSMKCWHMQEIVMTEKEDIEKIAMASKSAQELNKKRSLLISAIDKELGNDSFALANQKTY